jgi:hypothetical protein
MSRLVDLFAFVLATCLPIGMPTTVAASTSFGNWLAKNPNWLKLVCMAKYMLETGAFGHILELISLLQPENLGIKIENRRLLGRGKGPNIFLKKVYLTRKGRMPKGGCLP